MSTVKITELTEKTLGTNTANTIFVGVDLQTGVTGKYNAKTLAEKLYANSALNVGNNAVVFPGVIGQFVSNNSTYLQVNLQNFSNTGSGDLVVTADEGTDTTYFIDMGYAGSDYTFAGDDIVKPLDGYLLVQGSAGNPGGNLLIGTITPNRDITIFLGGTTTDNLVAKFSYADGFKLLNKPITFADGTTQNTSFAATVATTGNYANSAFLSANSAALYANGAFIQANTPSHIANSAALYANGAFEKANAALANTTGTFGGDLTVSGYLTPNKGLVYVPTLPEGSQTAITIDYTKDSIVKANCNTDVTITHTNFVSGKVVEVWLINNGVQNRTVTHGLSAQNSTTKSTTFTITSGSSAYLKFFSVDGDLANTFVAVIS